MKKHKNMTKNFPNCTYMTHIVITTHGPLNNIRTISEEEDYIQTEAWEYTKDNTLQDQSPNEIEYMEMELQDVPIASSYTYQQSTDLGQEVQTVHFMDKAITDVKKLLKQWYDEDGFSLDF